ncbi:hypothetical protein FOL47_001914, partial [Perkinsus chesapeaki]
WNVPLKFTQPEKALIGKLVKLLQKEMAGIGSTQACIHDSVKCDDSVLTLTSDASLEGYGFCIASGRDDIIIKSSAKPWNPRHHGASWHSNRRELYAFFQCATAADPIIRGSVKGRLLEVCCYMDNEASLSWLRKGCPGVKGMERVAVRRLVTTIRDLLLSWEEDCHVKISLIHIEASSSIRANESDNVQSLMTIDGMNLWGELRKLVSDQTRAQLDLDQTCWNGAPLMAMVVNSPEYLFLVLNTKLGTRVYIPPDGDHWIRRYGIPLVIRSDRGSSFCSRVMKAFYDKLHIEHRSSAGHHAESQGQVEAIVKLVKRLLERLVTSNLNVVPLLQRSINTLVRYPSASREMSWTPEVLLYGEATQGPLEILLESDRFRYHDGILPAEQPAEVAVKVKDIVTQFCEAWSQEVSIIRAKGVDRLNAKGGITHNELVESLSEGALVFRVLRDGLGRSKCTGPFIVEKLEANNCVKVYGMDTFIPLHQVRLCHSDPTSTQGCGFEIVQPDPHGLLPRPREQIPTGAKIMFLVVEWYDDKETWCYDLAIVKRNVYPKFFVRRLLMDDANQWSDCGAQYNIWIHSSQIIGEVQLTSRGRITQ